MCFSAIMQPIIRALGLAPKLPALPPAPRPVAPSPVEADGEAATAERMRARAARGRAATLLTGGQGDISAPALAKPAASASRMLLG